MGTWSSMLLYLVVWTTPFQFCNIFTNGIQEPKKKKKKKIIASKDNSQRLGELQTTVLKLRNGSYLLPPKMFMEKLIWRRKFRHAVELGVA